MNTRISDIELEALRTNKKCVVCGSPLPFIKRFARRLLCRSSMCKKTWTRVPADIRDYYAKYLWAIRGEGTHLLSDGTVVSPVCAWRDGYEISQVDWDELWYLDNGYGPVDIDDVISIQCDFFRPIEASRIAELYNEIRLLAKLNRQLESLSKIDFKREKMIIAGITPCFPCTYRINRNSQISL